MPRPFNQFSYPYDAVQLTDEIEEIPNLWGRIEEIGIFGAPEGIPTTGVEIAFEDGEVKVLQAKERGERGSVGVAKRERSVILKIPHFPHDETIKPDDLQDRPEFGTRRQQLRGYDRATAKKLLAIRRHHALTREFLRMGALKGNLYDGAGVLLYNLFTVFAVQQKEVDFVLGTDATDVAAKCDELVNHMQLNLKGDTMNGVHALVNRGFFRKLVSHPKVEKFYLGWQQAAMLAGVYKGQKTAFEFGGITWEPYDAVATGVDGQSKVFLAANDGTAFPLGTMNTFGDYNGPAHHIAFANAPGVDVFVSPKILDHGEGVELKSQSNPLPVVKRPAMLVRAYTSN